MTKMSFPRALATLAAADPQAVAVQCGEESLTRGELDRASNRLARAYAALGVGHGDMVTIGLGQRTGVVRRVHGGVEARSGSEPDLDGLCPRRSGTPSSSAPNPPCSSATPLARSPAGVRSPSASRLRMARPPTHCPMPHRPSNARSPPAAARACPS